MLLLVCGSGKTLPLGVLARSRIAAIDREPSRISARPSAAPTSSSAGLQPWEELCRTTGRARAQTTSQKMRRRLALYALLLAPAAAALGRGDAAPAFVGENYDGSSVTLASATGPKGLVLWFYPKAGTGG